jgi:hypothetical protein
MRCTFLFVFALTAALLGQSPTLATVEKSEHDSVIDTLATKLSSGFVLPEAAGRITQPRIPTALYIVAA